MDIKKTLFSYVISLISLVIIDGTWLSTMGQRFYAKNLSHLMATTITITPIVLFYLIYAVGVTLLVVLPTLEKSNNAYAHVFLLGALLGLVSYGAYDFTNHGTLNNWPLIVTIVDLAWGTFLTGTASLITYKLVALILNNPTR